MGVVGLELSYLRGDLIAEAWRRWYVFGHDTARIADDLEATECAVYNTLSRLRSHWFAQTPIRPRRRRRQAGREADPSPDHAEARRGPHLIVIK